MEESELFTERWNGLLECCLCGSLLKNPVRLVCLHNCCDNCFSAASLKSSSGEVKCGSCGTLTRTGDKESNVFIDHEVQRYWAVAETRMCGVCKENDELNKPALIWCSTCRHSLCAECSPAHRQYNRKHVTQPLEEVGSLEEMFPQSLTSTCSVHGRSVDIVCLKCKQAKCPVCCAECFKSKHDFISVCDESFEKYVAKFRDTMIKSKNDLLTKSEVLKKPSEIITDLKNARALHLEQIMNSKLLILETVLDAYEKIESSTKDSYDALEKQAEDARSTAEHITSNLSDAVNYVDQLRASNKKCEIVNQHHAVLMHLRKLSIEIDAVSLKVKNICVVNINPSTPINLENIIKSWIGVPVTKPRLIL